MFDRETSVDGAGTQRILEARARALAQPLQAEDAADTVTLVVMTLGSERYGVDARRALEVQAVAGLAPVSGTPPFWAGIMNVRGTLYPVLDLHRYMELQEPGANGDAKKVVLVSGPRLTIGVLVDEVPGIRRVAAAAIGSPLGTGTEAARRIFQGVTDDLVNILDVDALLSDPKLNSEEDA
jgi:purine-binding chemotaxis protein CheW